MHSIKNLDNKSYKEILDYFEKDDDITFYGKSIKIIFFIRMCVALIGKEINITTLEGERQEINGILQDFQIKLNPNIDNQDIYEVKNHCSFIQVKLSVLTKRFRVEKTFYISNILEKEDRTYYIEFNKKETLKLKFPKNFIKINKIC